MSGISNTISETYDTVVGYADDLSNALDFGSNPPPNDTVKPSNPEQDISTIDRSNPSNVEYAGTFGLPSYVVYGGAAVIGLILLKKFKVL